MVSGMVSDGFGQVSSRFRDGFGNGFGRWFSRWFRAWFRALSETID
jgi:hypothetical protein